MVVDDLPPLRGITITAASVIFWRKELRMLENETELQPEGEQNYQISTSPKTLQFSGELSRSLKSLI